MKAVGVKSLKAKLSEYLRLVKAGETVLVTERDQVIAEIKPANRQGSVSSITEFFDQAQEDGLITQRSDDSRRLPKPVAIQWVLRPSSARILNALREE